jgi:hypothetical protein
MLAETCRDASVRLLAGVTKTPERLDWCRFDINLFGGCGCWRRVVLPQDCGAGFDDQL